MGLGVGTGSWKAWATPSKSVVASLRSFVEDTKACWPANTCTFSLISSLWMSPSLARIPSATLLFLAFSLRMPLRERLQSCNSFLTGLRRVPSAPRSYFINSLMLARIPLVRSERVALITRPNLPASFRLVRLLHGWGHSAPLAEDWMKRPWWTVGGLKKGPSIRLAS